MTTKTFEPSVAWPVMVALNGLAVDSNPTLDENGQAVTPAPWSDVSPTAAEFQWGLGGGRDSTLMLYILNAMNPANNPYADATDPSVPAVPEVSDPGNMVPVIENLSGRAAQTAIAAPAKTFADQYTTHTGWDGTASGLASTQAAAALVRQKAAVRRSMGSMFTMNAGMAGMTAMTAHAPNDAMRGESADFAAGVALNAKQQQGEMFLRRWSAAARLWEAKQRGLVALASIQYDVEKAGVQAVNDALQLTDSTMDNYWRWRFDLWGYLLKGMSAVGGAPIQPREMTKKERVLAAVTNSASVALQMGASGGNPAMGLGVGAVSLAAQLWGMR